MKAHGSILCRRSRPVNVANIPKRWSGLLKIGSGGIACLKEDLRNLCAVVASGGILDPRLHIGVDLGKGDPLILGP